MDSSTKIALRRRSGIRKECGPKPKGSGPTSGPSDRVAEALCLNAAIPINFSSAAIGSCRENMRSDRVAEVLCLSAAIPIIFGAAATPSKEKTEATKLLKQYLRRPSYGGILSALPSLISSVMSSKLAAVTTTPATKLQREYLAKVITAFERVFPLRLIPSADSRPQGISWPKADSRPHSSFNLTLIAGPKTYWLELIAGPEIPGQVQGRIEQQNTSVLGVTLQTEPLKSKPVGFSGRKLEYMHIQNRGRSSNCRRPIRALRKGARRKSGLHSHFIKQK
ncbi:hypothetical protein HYC85_029396 [Camellia sinensis]|uniref:Uncharacterized protein n=1 Tax=Camellia sinensis TaxID=4442 RepID=A0A7J7FY57_CAMSI|nr:hypothetical protein HYC85_029396 [Camellia sinensis]